MLDDRNIMLYNHQNRKSELCIGIAIVPAAYSVQTDIVRAEAVLTDSVAADSFCQLSLWHREDDFIRFDRF
jgi:hypothetical protein